MRIVTELIAPKDATAIATMNQDDKLESYCLLFFQFDLDVIKQNYIKSDRKFPNLADGVYTLFQHYFFYDKKRYSVSRVGTQCN